MRAVGVDDDDAAVASDRETLPVGRPRGAASVVYSERTAVAAPDIDDV
jgi:hypothetical protein